MHNPPPPRFNPGKKDNNVAHQKSTPTDALITAPALSPCLPLYPPGPRFVALWKAAAARRDAAPEGWAGRFGEHLAEVLAAVPEDVAKSAEKPWGVVDLMVRKEILWNILVLGVSALAVRGGFARHSFAPPPHRAETPCVSPPHRTTP